MTMQFDPLEPYPLLQVQFWLSFRNQLFVLLIIFRHFSLMKRSVDIKRKAKNIKNKIKSLSNNFICFNHNSNENMKGEDKIGEHINCSPHCQQHRTIVGTTTHWTFIYIIKIKCYLWWNAQSTLFESGMVGLVGCDGRIYILYSYVCIIKINMR